MKDEKLVMEALAHASLFAGLAESALRTLAQYSEVLRCRAHENLRRAGDPAAHLMLVVTGVLEYSRTTPDGRRLTMRYHGSGEVGDLIPAVDGQGCVFDVTTHDATTLILLPVHEFRQLLRVEPRLLQNVSAALCDRSRFSYNLVEQLMTLSLRQRLATSLLELADVCGRQTEQGIEIQLKVSQEDLAAMLSASRQRVNAELRCLVREGAIATQYSRIRIVDRKALAEAASVAPDLIRSSIRRATYLATPSSEMSGP